MTLDRPGHPKDDHLEQRGKPAAAFGGLLSRREGNRKPGAPEFPSRSTERSGTWVKRKALSLGGLSQSLIQGDKGLSLGPVIEQEKGCGKLERIRRSERVNLYDPPCPVPDRFQ